MIRLLTGVLAVLIVFATATAPRAQTEVIEVTSPGGISAWLVREDSIPLLSLRLSFAGGAALDPADKAGASRMMAALLEEGAGDLDSVAFARAAQDLAARFGFGMSKDSATISATMLTEKRAETVELMRLALMDPAFSQEALDRVRPQALANLRADRTNPNSLAWQEFYDLGFPGDPFSLATDGTVETVTALTVEDLRAAHQRAFTRARVIVGAVGDITPQELGDLLDRLLGDLPGDAPALPDPAPFAASSETVVVPFDGPQAVAVFGHQGLARQDPDFLAAYVVNHALGGGGFGSRLTQELRENRGLTYGVSTSLSPGQQADLILGSVSSANTTIAEAVEAMRTEWARMARTGLSAEELEEVKLYLTGSYPLGFDGNGRVAGLLVSTQRAGLTPAYLQERNALVEALTLEEVNRVAARLLRPEDLRVVIAGRPEGPLPTQ